MDSREKVLRLREWLLSLKPEDESSAQMLQILVAMSPLLVKAIPDDAAELDRYLRAAAWGAAQCRSDDAPKLGLFEVVDGEWQMVDLAKEEAGI
ncbi:MAG TPA: hypothetical protein VNY83_04365 [Solirubrobacterales bacterium]|jgi:hypothetical protein|nr:hypothetical protein [Solirubrobacterales bacterium]